MKLSQALKHLSEKFKAENISVVLIGGFAVNAYGGSRLTTDIDFLLADNNKEKLTVLLKKEGFNISADQNLFSRFEKSDLAFKAIDFIYVEPKTFQTIMTAGKKITMANLEFIVPSVRHLIALKLHAIKNNKEWREYKDLPDIIELIKKNGVDVGSKDFQTLCQKYGSEGIYRRIQERVHG